MDEQHNTIMKTEEEIRVCTIGELKPLSGLIVIVNYDNEWPKLFEREAKKVRAALGDRVMLIEHAGSTSVPGLPAKPIIDMVLAVPNSALESDYVPKLEQAGYKLRIREPEWHEHRLFNGVDTDVNLHVFSYLCPEIDKMLLFRDWLRNNTVDRELYAKAKLELAQINWKYMQNYADAKTEIVEQIIKRATAVLMPEQPGV